MFYIVFFSLWTFLLQSWISVKPKLRLVQCFPKLYCSVMLAFKVQLLQKRNKVCFCCWFKDISWSRDLRRQYIFHDTSCHMVLESPGRKSSNNRKCFIPKARRTRGSIYFRKNFIWTIHADWILWEFSFLPKLKTNIKTPSFPLAFSSDGA